MPAEHIPSTDERSLYIEVAPAADELPTFEEVAYQYPHQRTEDVSMDALKRDVEAHPEQYHEALQPYIQKLLVDHVEVQSSKPTTAEDVMEKIEMHLVAEYEYPDDDEEGDLFDVELLSSEDARILIEDGKELTILTYPRYFEEFGDDIVQLLLEKKRYAELARELDSFPTLTQDRIIQSMLESSVSIATIVEAYKTERLTFSEEQQRMLIGKVARGRLMDAMTLAGNRSLITLSGRDLAETFIRNNAPYLVDLFLDNFAGIDESALIDALEEYSDTYDVIAMVHKFSADGQRLFWEKIDWRDKMESAIGAARHIEVFPDDENFVNEIVEYSIDQKIVENLLKFYSEELLGPKLYEAEQYHLLFVMQGDFYFYDSNDLFEKAREEYGVEFLADGIPYSNKLNVDAAREFIEAGYIDDVLSYLRSFDEAVDKQTIVDLSVSSGRLKEYTEAFMYDEKDTLVTSESLNQAEKTYAMNDSINGGLNFDTYVSFLLKLPESERPEIFRKLNRVFGGGVSQQIYRVAYDMIVDNHVDDEARQVGVTEAGWNGLEQFLDIVKVYMDEFRSAHISHETERKLVEVPLLRDVLMNFTGYLKSHWGEPDEFKFEQILRRRLWAVESERVELDTAESTYEPSRPYAVELIEKTPISKDTAERYEVIKRDIDKALVALHDPNGFKSLIEELKQSIANLADKYEAIKDIVPKTEKDPEKRVVFLEKQRQKLLTYLDEVEQGYGVSRQFVLASPEDVRLHFKALEQFKELHAPMRTLLYAWAARKNPHVQDSLEQLPTHPSIDDIAVMRDFVDHIVLQETFGDYFTDKKSARKFKEMSSTKAFDEAFSRQQQNAQKSAEHTVQFTSTNGLLLDLSGEIANACWAGKYGCLAAERPGLNAVIMKSNPDTEREKVVGAALLFRSFDARTGDPVLLLRGVNPLDEFINHVNVEQFYEALTDYVSQLAADNEMLPAIVIDDHAGGAGTNRVALHEYMIRKRTSMPNVRVDRNTTYFNTYDVSQMSYKLN